MRRVSVRWFVGLLWILVLAGGRDARADPRINEFVARPQGGEGEWIELIHTGSHELDLAGWTLNDGTGRRRALPLGTRMAPGSYLILASRPDSLRIHFALADSVDVVRPDGWPVLNDRDAGAGMPADVMVLRDATGVRIDSVAYFEDWLPPQTGVSLERGSPSLPGTDPGTWGWSLDPTGGTPGRANSLATGSREQGVLHGPPVVEPSRTPARFGYRLPGPGTLAIWLLDREGCRVAVLREPTPAPASGRWIWGPQHPRPGRSGLYFLCLRWEAPPEIPVRACRSVWVSQ